MNWIQLVRIAAVLAAWGAVVAGAYAARPARDTDSHTERDVRPTREHVAPDTGLRASLLRAARTAPFRASRQLPEVRYVPGTPDTPQVPEPAAPPKPVLTLVGLVLDGAPRALIQGIPGATGARMLGEGDTAGGVRVRRIQSDRVRLTGHDTSWTLKLRSVE